MDDERSRIDEDAALPAEHAEEQHRADEAVHRADDRNAAELGRAQQTIDEHAAEQGAKPSTHGR